MNTITIGVSSLEQSAVRATGEYQGGIALCNAGTAVQAPDPQASGNPAQNAVARRAGWYVKGAHTDVHALLEFGLLEKSASGKILCPFDEIRFDFALRAAA